MAGVGSDLCEGFGEVPQNTGVMMVERMMFEPLQIEIVVQKEFGR